MESNTGTKTEYMIYLTEYQIIYTIYYKILFQSQQGNYNNADETSFGFSFESIEKRYALN